MKKIFFLNVVVPLFVGTILYYLFCPDVYFVKQIDLLINFDIHFECPNNNLIFDFIRFYLFDFLWAYSLMTTSLIFMKPRNVKYLFLIVSFFEMIFEILQIIPTVNGTYDIFDIFIEILANILGIKNYIRRRVSDEKA